MNMDEIIHKLNLTERCEAYYPLSAHNYVDFLIIAISIGMLIFALISWKTITDFRSFKNYIFIYVIFINTMNAIFRNITIECIADKFKDPITVLAIMFIAEGLYNYFELTANYWLMLLFYDTYLNVVKIYNNLIVRRYLKANLWGWGMPFLICLFIYFIIPALIPASGSFIIFVKIMSKLVPVVFNGIMYFIILFSLLKIKMVSSIGEKKCRYLRMLIFLFKIVILSSLTTVMPMCECVCEGNLPMIKLIFSIKDLTIMLYFLTGTHNRSLWTEHYGKNQSKRLLNSYF